MMGMVARQFGHPRGVLGRIVGRGMVRSNGDFSRWTIGERRRHLTWVPTRIVELGPGPGVGLEELLGAFPDAKVWGVDPSREMLGLSRQRNAAAAEGGRLALLEGGVASLVEVAPVDIVAANHVLYFWQEPEAELRRIRGSLRSGGLLAIGYQLRQNMPATAQKAVSPAGVSALRNERGGECAPSFDRLRGRRSVSQGIARTAGGMAGDGNRRALAGDCQRAVTERGWPPRDDPLGARRPEPRFP